MYFEEFQVNQKFELPTISLSEQEIDTYAHQYDPQPIHIDSEFAEAGLFKGIIASGFHTMSAIWGQWIRENVFGTEIIGGIGLDYVKWLLPVRAGDQLDTVVQVDDTIPSSKGGRGVVVLTFVTTNQNKKDVLAMQARVIIKSKES